MQDGEIQNKTIKIVKVEEGLISTGTKKKKITDQDGKNYTFFLHTKEGIKTKTYEQYLALELGVGSVARIGFVVETFELKQGKDAGKQGKVNKVISFGEPFDQDRAEVEQPPIEPELDEAPDKLNPPGATGNGPVSETAVWEAKDRLHAAQTAANFVATIHEGSGKDPLTLKGEMNEVYAWLLAKKSGGGETTGEDISVEDIPSVQDIPFS